MAELEQRLVCSILYGKGLESNANFQTYSDEPIEIDGSKFYFLDANLSDTNKRQAQFSSMPQRMIIRSNPDSSQSGVEIPGLSFDSTDFSLLRIIQLIKDTKGLRGALLRTQWGYTVSDSPTTDDVRERSGIYQVSNCKIAGGNVILTLQTDITPISPLMPDIRRLS